MWKEYWPVYERLENEFCDLTFSVALNDAHLEVYSLRLAELILRICGECENVAKTLITQLKLEKPSRLDFPSIGNTLSRAVPFQKVMVEVVWPYQNLSNTTLKPFLNWSNRRSKNPSWYDAYNGIKHNRNSEFCKANFANAMNALAGLFALNLWLRRDDIEAETQWIVLARKKINSYSSFFSPEQFLKLGAGSTQRRLKFAVEETSGAIEGRPENYKILSIEDTT
ncbi:MAG: hypothetical protein OEV28_09875 [Nitrospirota bacterium]|nr:hypothetical protein [Nitrospirota bacterium]